MKSMTLDYIARANATARSAGAVGARALVPRVVIDLLHADSVGNRIGFHNILNFGAGKPGKDGHFLHSEMIRKAHPEAKVHEYDFGKNYTGLIIHPGEYDLVFASNVMNVQSSVAMMRETLKQIGRAVRDGGMVILNHPSSPRHHAGSDYEVYELCRSALGVPMHSAMKVGGTKSSPVWMFRDCRPRG